MHVICPQCSTPSVLPDPWPHPGYTCPHCSAPVSLGFQTGYPAPPARAGRGPSKRRNAFGDGFEGAFGCALALIVMGVAAVVAVFWFAAMNPQR
jgi:hypothetical protein